MSARFPPHVELMRPDFAKTLFGTSSIRREAMTPQTCIFLPKQSMSGWMP